MALTGTSTKKVKADIMTHLHLSDEDTDIVYKSPDRPNIFIQILKRESSEYEMSLGWLIDHIRLNGIKSNSMYYCNRCFRNGIRYPRCTACCPHRLSKVYSVILARSGLLCERW